MLNGDCHGQTPEEHRGRRSPPSQPGWFRRGNDIKPTMLYPFEYRKLGDFAYHVLPDPNEIKKYVMHWILREWEMDHNEAPHEHWTVQWMSILPQMGFSLEVLPLDDIRPNADLWGVDKFQNELKARADEREWSILRGGSIEPLLVNQDGLELMDGYTRYTVLKRYEQKQAYVYLGHV
jgi:hypothetical protein